MAVLWAALPAVLIIFLSEGREGGAAYASSFYDDSDVIQLDEKEFRKQVLSAPPEEVWFVKFYAPWGGHCKHMAPELKKAATSLKGFAKVAAIDGIEYSELAKDYNVQGFPTLKIFGSDKSDPENYYGDRSSSAIVSAVKHVLKGLTERKGN